ncbi:hypothetical protein [Sphingomonas xinjiangensis]|uniref:Uncharacterized protein n=1 Tax=Sphingomonas xinjiangensis TaxID=643568 RepID=A0A840YQW4_9SPHN|nr:hypothetical protein [Sphingomonas xinjiangensis]MBB5710943.1 hypothetical protein [Sphingomonas xinjiangensis]
MTNSVTSQRASTLWIMVLTLASTATTLAFACATPFPALAALTAVHMRQRDGVALAIAAWVASQAVGFGFLGYPHDLGTMLVGAAIGVAAVAGAIAAHATAARMTAPLAARLAAAYLAGFAAFKLVILAFTLAKGDPCTAFTAEVLGRQLLRNAAIMAGLLALYRALVAIGVPAARPPMAAA